MKVTHRIPTTQYGYVEVSADIKTDTESIEIGQLRQIHEQLLGAFAEKPQNTLPDKEMTDFLYAQIHGKGNHIETYEMMNPAQKTFINQLKKALARK